MDGVGAHQAQIAAVFALGAMLLFCYRLFRPNHRPGTIVAFSLLCGFLSACFVSTAYLGDAARTQVLGSALVGLGVCFGWSVVSLRQADHLWASSITFSERAVLRACPYIMGTALTFNIVMGMLFPVPVLEFYAAAPLHYLPYKLVLLVPQTFCVGFSAYVFFKASGPSAQVGRVRAQNFSFFLGSSFLDAIGFQAMANACVRVFADRQTRHSLVPVILTSEFVLTVLFVVCFLGGIVLYYSKSERDRIVERFVRWRRHREVLDRALWSLAGSAYEGRASILARVTFAADDLRRRSEEEERDGLPRAFLPGDTRKAADTVRILILLRSQQRFTDRADLHTRIRSLNRFHNYLLKDARTAGIFWRVADDNTHPTNLYSLRSDPIREPLSRIPDLVFNDRAGPSLIAEPQWLQLAAVAAADAGLVGPKYGRRILDRHVVMERVFRAYENAKLATQIQHLYERSGTRP